MIYIWYKYFCVTDNLWKVHNTRIMVNMSAPTLCHCHSLPYKAASLSVCKTDCEIKKITGAMMNGNKNLDKSTATLGDVIDRLECICVCLNRESVINYVDQ